MNTILCIDDDTDDLMLIREAILLHKPYDIIEATNGTDALQKLEEFRLTDRLPCLMILDINMPGMDGKMMVQQLKADPVLATIPVAIFTTSSSKKDVSHFSAEGVKFVTKPVHFPEFEEKIKQIITELAAC